MIKKQCEFLDCPNTFINWNGKQKYCPACSKRKTRYEIKKRKSKAFIALMNREIDEKEYKWIVANKIDIDHLLGD